tara:strand:- start:202 stop:312 length:111 start_codon:yes stop_codon:yes gene_type:complete
MEKYLCTVIIDDKKEIGYISHKQECKLYVEKNDYLK